MFLEELMVVGHEGRMQSVVHVGAENVVEGLLVLVHETRQVDLLRRCRRVVVGQHADCCGDGKVSPVSSEEAYQAIGP